MRISTSALTYLAGIVFFVLALAGCSLEKESAVNRAMQNLTAHYNILFNAKELLREKQDQYQAGYIDDYENLLSVYQDTVSLNPNAADKELDAAIAKANNIIAVKEQSKYIGDAYLLLGKANHLYGRYFNSVEYLKYVITSFPSRADLAQEARVWQVRSLLYLDQLPEAKPIIEAAVLNINPKKIITADVYATALQYHINAGEYPEAEQSAKLAIQHAYNKESRLRWTFILAQLQELNKEPTDAYANYLRVAKSNASFEMSFNANLNRIRLEDDRQGVALNRMERLRRLLRDDKNKEFTDQIYYQIALLYLAQNDFDNALKNFQLSVRNSTKNQNQKGLSYLRMADINFKNKADYTAAKKYYDSTLTSLSPGYPNYEQIKKKADNLQILADRLRTIAHEDTLQQLAKLDEKERTAKIDELVGLHLNQLQSAAAAADAQALDPFNNMATVEANATAAATGNSFYFYNPASVSQGFTDFKRKWGNRKLEDNWRRSKKAGGDITMATSNIAQNVDPDAVPNQIQKNTDQLAAANYRQNLTQNLPLTAALMEQSNQRVYNAYMDIANFYRDILQARPEAIEMFETMLTRFPNDANRAMIYYNLYRLYTENGSIAKANTYKDMLLKQFPESVYAKVINDPDYSKRLSDRNAEFDALYNTVYDLLTQRKYTDVMQKTDELLKQYPDNHLAPQLAYLHAIAQGHQVKIAPFREEILQITTKYPQDALIVPLINQHLIFIDANRADLDKREFALLDGDPNEVPFAQRVEWPVLAAQPIRQSPVQNQPKAEQSKPQPEKPAQQAKPPVETKVVATKPPVVEEKKVETKPPVTEEKVAEVKPPVTEEKVAETKPPVTENKEIENKPPVVQPQVTQPPANNPVVIAPKPTPKPSIFSLRDTTNFLFVVNVSSGTSNLASSRFGIGQFNRTNYQGNSVKHLVKEVGADNQLIYVGRFDNLAAVKDYARAIIPLMPQIMKVPADKYSFFIITQENLNKLADKKTLDSYVEFYQNNYLR